MPNSLKTVVIVMVTIVWGVNFIAPIFVRQYEPSPELNVAFMAIIGVLTASYKMDKDEKDPPSEDGGDDE